MWIINCILLVIGTVAAVCGISFYVRNKEASGNIRFYIFFFGICAGIWCIFFGLIGFCADFKVCDILRKIGDIGVIGFLITETFLVMDISGVRSGVAKTFKWLAVLTGIVDYLLFSRSNVDQFVREDGWTTWVPDPTGAANRTVHSCYVLFTFIVLFSFGLVWLKNNKVKRLRRFLFLVFAANFNILFFSIPDTLLPTFGLTAIPTSGIGGALCAIVMWYGATQLGSFDIRTGNIKDRLFDFIEAGVIVFEVDRRVAMLNRYCRKLSEAVGVSGKGLEDFFDITAEDADKAFRSSMDAVYTARFWNRERTRAYSVRLSAVKDSYAEVFCFLCVFVDVTEEVEAVSKFEVASHAKSRFLAQMSHEIRTPINAVLGMNEMILRESDDNTILEYAQNIDSAGNTLLALINSILDFSKIEDGKMEIVPVKYDTASFINDLYHSIIQRADAKGLAFAVDIDETLPCALIGDDVRLSQVIMNLLTNAVKYTEKGSVTLSLRMSEKQEGRVRIAVSVKDTGIGIRKEDRERLFESFERLDKVRNHSIEGTGLGMSIVTSLLTLMRSRLSVESTYGEGSEFSFTIEQAVAEETPIGDYERRLKESSLHKDKEDVIIAPNARILVIDDNEMNLKVARNLLKLCGIKPEEAASGKEAISFMEKNTYDIVFLDHMMPEMDGIETLHKLKEKDLIPENTVMIALTANAVVGARESYLSEGFDDYLSKPIEVKHLVEKLKAYLPEQAYGDNGADCASEEEGVMEFAPEDAEVLEFEPKEDAEEFLEFRPEEENEEDEAAFAAGDIVRKTKYDLEKLKALGMDTVVGLSYCAGDEELYFEMINDFLSSCDGKIEELDGFYQREDWHAYEVAVHALKSNVRMIGLNRVYEQAKNLEEAAERKDAGYIKERHNALITLVRDITGMI